MKKSSQRGSCLGGLASVAIGLVMIFLAGSTALEVAANRSVTEMSLDQYAKEKPSAKWVRLTDCQVNLIEAVYEYEDDDESKITEVYVPVHPPGEVQAAYVVVQSDEYISFIKAALKVQDDAEALGKYLADNDQRLTEVKTFEGWISSSSSLTQEKFTSSDVVPGFVMLKVGEVKGWGEAAIFGVIGLLLLAVGAASFLKRD